MANFIRTQQGQLHSISDQLTSSNGPLDIPPGCTVTFVGMNGLQPPSGPRLPSIGGPGVIVRVGATIDDPNRGVVRYDLSTADVANPGLFYCQWLLVPPNSTFPQPIPESNRITLLVVPRPM